MRRAGLFEIRASKGSSSTCAPITRSHCSRMAQMDHNHSCSETRNSDGGGTDTDANVVEECSPPAIVAVAPIPITQIKINIYAFEVLRGFAAHPVNSAI